MPPARYVWYVIFLLALVNVFNYMDRMALAILLPLIKKDMVLTDGQLGLLLGFAFSIFYAICGIPVASWADRGVRRNIIAIALTVWSVMTAVSGAAQNFWHLFAARVGAGAGESGGLPPAQSLISDYVSPERRSGAFAIHSAGLFIGMMVGMVLAGWLGERLGWRWTFVLLGAPGVAVALIVRLTLREPVRGNLDAVNDNAGTWSFYRAISALWHCRTYRRLMCFLVAFGFVQSGLNQWWPSFYTRVFGLSPSAVGAYLGAAMGAGSTIGLLIGGGMANRLTKKDSRLPLVTGAVAMFGASLSALSSLFVSSATGSILLVFLTSVLWSSPLAAVVAAVQNVTHPRARATASAVSIFFQSVLGFGLGPFCVGVLSDALNPEFGALSLRYAMLAPICLFPLAVAALFAAAKLLSDDLKALGFRVKHGSAATASNGLATDG